MLPSPVTSAKRRGFRRLDVRPRRTLLSLLQARSRFTNLGVVLLSLFALFSLYHNLRFWYTTCRDVSSNNTFGSALWETLTRPIGSEDLKHLVIIPGHAIWTGHDPEKRLEDSEWILEPYQKGKPRLEALFQHIQQGLQVARSDKRALVVFSGGQTRPQSSMTEAQSYLRLALASMTTEEFKSNSSPPTRTLVDVSERLTTEDHALDSYQNLLFSIARFKEYTGRYPEHITVVGYEFKRARFEKLHRAAIRWHADNFEYLGVDPDDIEHLRVAKEGELANGYNPYSKDTYGCHETLLDKRRKRNPFRRFHSYYLGAPDLSGLLDWCPTAVNGEYTTLFSGTLPWDL